MLKLIHLYFLMLIYRFLKAVILNLRSKYPESCLRIRTTLEMVWNAAQERSVLRGSHHFWCGP